MTVAEQTPLVEMRGINVAFGGVHAVRDVSIDLKPGEVIGLVGGNGAGKSTLMRVLSGAHPADSGEIFVNGEAVSIKNPRDAKAQNIETIYQTLALADNVDAPANVFLGRELTTRWGTLDDSSMEDATRKVMKRLNPNFTRFAQPVRSLSGGQRQAVAIARAVHFNAQVLIMDEPTAALGPAETAQVRDLVRQLKTEGIGIFLISHDIHDVFDLSDRVSVMYHGRIVGTVDKSDVTTDEILGMIILGKRPGEVTQPGAGRAQGLTANRAAFQEGHPVPDEFFTDVPGRIGFGGLGSTDPLTYAVYEPDRLVLGKRMEDHLRIGVCLWHSFAWDGRDMFGIGTLDRPWLDPAGRPDAGRPPEDGRRVRVHREARRPVLLLPRPRRRAGGCLVRRIPGQPRRAHRRRTRVPGADRRAAAVGHGQPVHAPALPGRRLDQPRSRGLRLRRGPGQAHARGHAAPRRHELRPVGRARGLRHAAQHGPQARGQPARPVPAPRRRAQAPDRLRGHAPDRAQADGADEAPIRLRLSARSMASWSATGWRTSTA